MTRRLDDYPAGHPAWDLLLGGTPLQVCAVDPRFAFTTYIPASYRTRRGPLPLHVAVHGTGRHVESMRDRFARFADEAGVAVLAPLFPVGIGGPDDVDNYKHILFEGIRFDEILLAMIRQAGERWELEQDRFLLSGFSGGGQFALRFAYLHPDRLRAVSVGAPGRVTLPDDEPWPHGLAGADEVFGAPVELSRLAGVPVQVVVGGDDDAAELLAAVATDAREARAGRTRVERALRLAADLSARGIDVETRVVPGVAHDGAAVTPVVVDFLLRALAHARTAPAEPADTEPDTDPLDTESERP